MSYRALQKILMNKEFNNEDDDISCTYVNGCFHIKPKFKIEYNNETIGLEEEKKATCSKNVKLYAIAKMDLGDKKIITYGEIDHYNQKKDETYDIYEIKTCDLRGVLSIEALQRFIEGIYKYEKESIYPSKKSLKILIGEYCSPYINHPELVCLKNLVFRIETVWLKVLWNERGKSKVKGLTILTKNLTDCIEQSNVRFNNCF